MKKKLLFLVHRLPYPPNKGDKIASFNLLRFLAQRYEVFVGTFIDDPDDRQYLDKVHEYCSALCAPEIRPGLARIASLRGLLTGEALSLPYLRNRELQRWTTDVLRDEHPERIVIFSGPMAQYVSGRVPANAVTLFDMVDVDSEKWRSYGERKRWPMSWLYRREADRLLAFERRMAAEFDSTVFVSTGRGRAVSRPGSGIGRQDDLPHPGCRQRILRPARPTLPTPIRREPGRWCSPA